MANDIIDLDPATGAYTTADDPDRGRRKRSDARQILDNVDGLWAWTIAKAIAVVLILMTAVWAADFYGTVEIQIGLFFISVLTTVLVAASMKVTIAIFVLGSLLGREQGQSLFAAGSETAKAWWRKGALGVLLTIAVYQAIWIVYPWSVSLGAYWFFVGAGLIFVMTMYYFAIKTKYLPHILLWGSGGAMLLVLVFSALGWPLLQNQDPVNPTNIPVIGAALPERKLTPAELEDAKQVAADQAAIQAAADAAAEDEKARAAVESLVDAKAVPCQRKNTDMLGCMTVTFGYNSKYDRTARYDDATATAPAKGYCIAHDGGDRVKWEPLAGDRSRFIAPEGSIVQFFDLPPGETWRGKKCG